MSQSQHTPGPWAWYGHPKFGMYLATTHSGRIYVMDFVRQGTQGAQPRFQPQPDRGMVKAEDLVQFCVGLQTIVGVKNRDSSVYRQDIRGIACADARLIAAAPCLLKACKAALDVLTGKALDEAEPHAPSGAAINLLASAIHKAEDET